MVFDFSMKDFLADVALVVIMICCYAHPIEYRDHAHENHFRLAFLM